MEWNKNRVKSYGYKLFEPLSIKTDMVIIHETAMKNGEPFLAMAQKSGRKRLPDTLLLASLPSSIQFVAVGGEPESLYQRNRDDTFLKCHSLPKADGTQWGNHTRGDLISAENIRYLADHIKKLLSQDQYEAFACILCFKILDELSEDEIFFKTGGNINDTLTMLNNMAAVSGLEKEWEKISTYFNDHLNKAVMILQPYSFLPDAKTYGIFGIISDMIHWDNTGRLCFQDKISSIILSLLAGKPGLIYIAGLSAVNLLDLAIIGGKAVRFVGRCHALIKTLGKKFIGDFDVIDVIADKLPRMKNNDRCPVIICIPPFGQKITDSKATRNIELASGAKGKRTKSADSELVWLDKCYHLLKENGWLLFLFSEGFLSNASLVHAREWVMSHFQIESVISLPNIFYQSSIKTSLVCLRKTISPPDDYNIFMAELEEKDFDNISPLVKAYRTFKKENEV